jgi:hypothetical protein
MGYWQDYRCAREIGEPGADTQGKLAQQRGEYKTMNSRMN